MARKKDDFDDRLDAAVETHLRTWFEFLETKTRGNPQVTPIGWQDSKTGELRLDRNLIASYLSLRAEEQNIKLQRWLAIFAAAASAGAAIPAIIEVLKIVGWIP